MVLSQQLNLNKGRSCSLSFFATFLNGTEAASFRLFLVVKAEKLRRMLRNGLVCVKIILSTCGKRRRMELFDFINRLNFPELIETRYPTGRWL